MWRFNIEVEVLWRKVVECKYRVGNIIDFRKWKLSNYGGLWKRLCFLIKKNEMVIKIFSENIRKVIGNGSLIIFWEDRWFELKFLKEMYLRLYFLFLDKKLSMVNMGL